MTNRLAHKLWREVSIAARETPRMYFGTVKDIADAMGRFIHATVEHVEPQKKASNAPNLLIVPPTVNKKLMLANRANRARRGGLRMKNRAAAGVKDSSKEIAS
jgi:hypothetical protein